MLPLAQRLFAGALLLAAVANPAGAQPHAYVPNFAGNDLSVIDAADNSTITIRLPGVNDVQSVAANAAGTHVYLGSRGTINRSAAVLVLDTLTGTISAGVDVPLACLQGIAVNPAGTRAYVTGSCSDNVVVLDTTTSPMTVLANISNPGLDNPVGIAVSPDGEQVYVANFFAQNIAVIDTRTSAHTVAFIPTPGRNPLYVAVDADGHDLWLTHDGSSPGVTRISAVDTAPVMGAVVRTGNCPRGIALDSSRRIAYATDACGNTMSVIDADTATLTTSAATGSCPAGVSVSPGDGRVFVANSCSNSVSIYNASGTAAAIVATGINPFAYGIFIPQGLHIDPAAMIAALMAEITDAGLGLPDPLLAPLAAALSWLNGNNPNQSIYACKNLGKFIELVAKKIAAGRIPPSIGNAWTSTAEAVMSDLNCRG